MADPKPVVSRETLERLAKAVDAWYGMETTEQQPGWCDESKEMFRTLSAYRAESTPKLRTLAEVDREIGALLREDVAHGPGIDCLGYDPTAKKLRLLCVERVAPEPEKPPGKPVVRIQWQCSSCGWGFFGPHQKTCPGCGVDDYWCGSVAPDCKPWPGYPCAPAPGCKAKALPVQP